MQDDNGGSGSKASENSQDFKAGYQQGLRKGIELGRNIAIVPENQLVHFCIDGNVYARDLKDPTSWFRRLSEQDAAIVKQSVGLLNPLQEKIEEKKEEREPSLTNKEEPPKYITIMSGSKVSTYQRKDTIKSEPDGVKQHIDKSTSLHGQVKEKYRDGDLPDKWL